MKIGIDETETVSKSLKCALVRFLLFGRRSTAVTFQEFFEGIYGFCVISL